MRAAVTALAIVALASVLDACGHATKAQSRQAAATADVTANAGHGRAVYEAQCAACHGRDGTGGEIGPALRNERLRRSGAAIRSAILNPEPPMPKLFPARMSAGDLNDVTAYVETL